MRTLSRAVGAVLLFISFHSKAAESDPEVVRFSPRITSVDGNAFRIDLRYGHRVLGIRVQAVRSPAPLSRSASEYREMQGSNRRISNYDFKREHFAELSLSYGFDQGKVLTTAFAGDRVSDLKDGLLQGLSLLCSRAGFSYAKDFEFDFDPGDLRVIDLLNKPELSVALLSQADKYVVYRTLQSDLLIVLPEAVPDRDFGFYQVCLAQEGDRERSGCKETAWISRDLAFGVKTLTCMK